MILTLRDIERLENTSFASVISAADTVAGYTLDFRCIIGDISPGCIDYSMRNCPTGVTDDTCQSSPTCLAPDQVRLLTAVRAMEE